MKRYLLPMIVALALLAGCGQTGEPPVGEESIRDDSSSAVESSGPADPEPGEEQPVQGPMELPDPESIPLEPLPFEPMDLWGDEIELVYIATPATGGLLDALAEDPPSMDSDGNYIVAGDYLLYSTMHTPMGPSRVCAEGPDGVIEELLISTQAVMGMYVLDERTLVLNLVETVYPEGYSGQYYELDLETGDLAPSDTFARSASGYTVSHTLHRGFHYYTNNADGATDMGEGYDLFVADEGGDRLVLPFINSWQFRGDFIYYMDRDRMQILRSDLLGGNRELYQAFDEELLGFTDTDQGLLCTDASGGTFVRDPETGVDTPLDVGYGVFIDEGVYRVTDEKTLEFLPWGGEPEVLYENFQGYPAALVDDRLYYYTFHSGEINRYRDWRLVLGEAEPTLLN